MNLQVARDVAALIDHTLLKPETTSEDILRLCQEAHDSRFASVCVNPFWVTAAARALAGSTVKVCTVIGFPLGANRTAIKMTEAERALAEGARELDMVLNIGALRSGDTNVVEEEIRLIAEAAHGGNALVKVILETSLLTDTEKEAACRLAREANADFVKTSTGFSAGGATAADVALMRRSVGTRLGVKASGGVRTLAALQQMVEAGATRIGTSSGLGILKELQGEMLTAAPSRAGSY